MDVSTIVPCGSVGIWIVDGATRSWTATIKLTHNAFRRYAEGPVAQIKSAEQRLYVRVDNFRVADDSFPIRVDAIVPACVIQPLWMTSESRKSRMS